MERMNGLERTEAVLSGSIPDRVPVALHNFLLTLRMMGVPLDQGLRDGKTMAEAQVFAWRQFGHDVLMLENGVGALAEAVGCTVRYKPDQPPHVEQPLDLSLAEIAALPVPDPERVFPLTENLLCTRIVAQETGGKAFVMGRADQGPAALALAICGVERFLMALLDPDERPAAEGVLDFTLRCDIAYGLAQRRAGAHGTSIGGLGTSLLSPGLFREVEGPRQQAFCAAMRSAGIRSFVHVCGNEEQILPELVDTGADSLELDPRTSPMSVKAAIRDRCAVLGMVDPAQVVQLGTPAQVRAATAEAIRVLAPGGGLLVGPGCALAATTPVENVEALVAAAKEFGRYRSDGRLMDGDW